MADGSLYDEDILIWSERQVVALRSLVSRRDLPNELDLTNVIEEIEDVGRSEFHGVESLVSNILSHLLLLRADPDAPAVRGWIAEVTAWNLTLARRITPSMRSRLDMDSLWRDAVEVAAARLAVWDQAKSVAVAGRRGTASPFTAADFPVAAIEIVNAAARIQAG
ncbi:MAG TPA: DUF29 domain-containing protein [Acetobacteraceae bacterium]|jgi:hypothetical protein